MHYTYIHIDKVWHLRCKHAKQKRITVRQVVQNSPKHAELLRMVEVSVAKTDEGTRRRSFEGCNVVSKASTNEELSMSQLLACRALDCGLPKPGGDSMNCICGTKISSSANIKRPRCGRCCRLEREMGCKCTPIEKCDLHQFDLEGEE